MEQYNLSSYDATILVSSKAMAAYYEEAVRASGNQPKLAANWLISELLGALNRESLDLEQSPIAAADLGKLVMRIGDDTISGKIAKTIFEALWNKEGDVDAIIEKRGLKQVTDTGAIEKLIDEIIAANPEQTAEYRSGKEKLFGFFVGQAMKASAAN